MEAGPRRRETSGVEQGWKASRHLHDRAAYGPTSSAAAPHEPPRSAVACRSAVGRPILCRTSPITTSLIEELDRAPESVQRGVLAFLRHLRARGAGSHGSEDVHALLPLAESVRAADWASHQEDATCVEVMSRPQRSWMTVVTFRVLMSCAYISAMASDAHAAEWDARTAAAPIDCDATWLKYAFSIDTTPRFLWPPMR